MTSAASAWAWKQDVPPRAKYVLVAIADKVDQDGRWYFASAFRLVLVTGLGFSEVREEVAALEAAGRIDTGENQGTTITLLMSQDDIPQQAS